MKLQRLKSVLFSVFAVVTVCLLGSCHRVTPRWTNSYFHREANVKRICDTMAGTYDMSYFRIYRTDLRGGQDVLKDSVIRAMLPDSAAPLQYVVGGYGDQRITIPNFPISLVAPCLKDTALARAVASAPLQNLLVRYGSPLQFSLDDVKILGGSNQDFGDGWSNGPTFDIYINGERVDQAGQPVRRR